jgi:hypothetical protein
MGDPLNPKVGDREFNGAEFDYLEDVEPSVLQSVLTAQEGSDAVLVEVTGNMQEWAEKAGMTPTDVADFTTLNQRIARIDVFLAPAQKFAEMLLETRYLLEDRRQRILLNLGASVERRGKQLPELLAKYEKTRAYRSAAGKKAARTRRRNAEQGAQPQTPAPVNGEPQPAPAPAPVIG